MKGRVYSVESMGLVDGPGIRFVVFLQGCAIRCSFCHNPDSRDLCGGEIVESDELMSRILRFRPYFERSGGGVTFSGGEPLLQKDFLIEMLTKCRENGVHTCIDTAGVGAGDYQKILNLCDMVLYDVKAVSMSDYNKICGGDIKETEKFLDVLKRTGTETIVRQVVIPGINNTDDYMVRLKKYIKEKIPHAASVELLPYHRMGSHKYEKLGMREPLEGVPAMDKTEIKMLWEKHFNDWLR